MLHKLLPTIAAATAIIGVTAALAFGQDDNYVPDPLADPRPPACRTGDTYPVVVITMNDRTGTQYRFRNITGPVLESWDDTNIAGVGGIRIPYDSIKLIDARCA